MLFLNEHELEVLSGIEREHFQALEDHRVLLYLSLPTGERCYPLFQFSDGQLNGELIALFQLFPKQWSDWEITCWFHSYNSYLFNTPLETYKIHCNTDRLRLVISTETHLAEL